jgi:hypothetical protein
MQTDEISELHAHHAGPDRAAPPPGRFLGWPNSGIAHRFLGRRERETV